MSFVSSPVSLVRFPIGCGAERYPVSMNGIRSRWQGVDVDPNTLMPSSKRPNTGMNALITLHLTDSLKLCTTRRGSKYIHTVALAGLAVRERDIHAILIVDGITGSKFQCLVAPRRGHRVELILLALISLPRPEPLRVLLPSTAIDLNFEPVCAQV